MKWCFYIVVMLLFTVSVWMFFFIKKQSITINKIEVKSEILQQGNLQLQEMMNLRTEFENSIFPRKNVLLTNNMVDYYTIDHFINKPKTLCVFFPNSVCNPCLDSINEILRTAFLNNLKTDILIICELSQYKLRKEQFCDNSRIRILAYNSKLNKERIMNLSSLVAFHIEDTMIINNFIVIDKHYLDILRFYLNKMTNYLN
ncbi:hypothetical protein [Parabacteroides chinchillae]